jgi:2-oxoisovalerate dehydrogenase E1 component alpha subunit
MSTSISARFEIGYSCILDSSGRTQGALPEFAMQREAVLAMYRAMLLTRTFDSRAVALQRTGRLGTYASSLGQEAIPVGIASAMQANDVLLPSFREHGAQLMRGVTLLELLQYWGGDERGSCFGAQPRDFPACITVGGHATHAVGAAQALRYRGEHAAVVCVFGDGATSKGDVYEALNIAGAWRSPVVFVINNNQWAISVPREAQSAAATLAQKAIAAGIGGEQVDGNDVFAVRQALATALERARAGGGAYLVEALSYRLGDHTTADDASRYRDDAAVSPHWKDDPLTRVRAYVEQTWGWSREQEEQLQHECSRLVEEASQAWLGLPAAPASSIFEHLYARLPEALEPQLATLLRHAGEDARHG